jgi:hypothetical protein
MSSDNVLIYDPEGIAIGEYRTKYPDLKGIPEFQNLSDFELVMVWYFINPTSFYVYKYPNKRDRIKEICKKMYAEFRDAKNYSDKFINRNLLNQDDIDEAVIRMGRIIPDARLKAKQMADKIFDDYKPLLELPIDSFKKAGGETDYSQYLAVRKQITKDIEDIIQKVECGYGINRVGEISTDGQSIIEDYHKNKMQ